MIPGLNTAIATLPSLPTAGLSPSPAPAGGGFSDVLKTAINNVDNLQASSDMQIGNLVHGAPNTDVGNVMVSVEKADVAFQLMMQVRNKIVSAYQDIEKMQF